MIKGNKFYRKVTQVLLADIEKVPEALEELKLHHPLLWERFLKSPDKYVEPLLAEILHEMGHLEYKWGPLGPLCGWWEIKEKKG